MKIFCDRFKELRKDKGLSAVDLAGKLGVRDSTIIRWENGVMLPRIDQLVKICLFFRVSPGYLLGLEDY